MSENDLRNCSEIVQIEFRRRADCVSAILHTSHEIWEQQIEPKRVIETFQKNEKKHLAYIGLVLLGIYAYKHWDSPILEILSFVGWIALWGLISAHIEKFEYGRKFDALCEQETALHTQWMAAGADISSLRRFKSISTMTRDEQYDLDYRSAWDATMRDLERRATGQW